METGPLGYTKEESNEASREHCTPRPSQGKGREVRREAELGSLSPELRPPSPGAPPAPGA